MICTNATVKIYSHNYGAHLREWETRTLETKLDRAPHCCHEYMLNYSLLEVRRSETINLSFYTHLKDLLSECILESWTCCCPSNVCLGRSALCNFTRIGVVFFWDTEGMMQCHRERGWELQRDGQLLLTTRSKEFKTDCTMTTCRRNHLY